MYTRSMDLSMLARGACILALALLVGCGSGGTKGGFGGGGNALNWTSRNVVMDAAATKLASLASGPDLDAQNATLLAYVQTLPNVKAATLQEGSITVTLTDDSFFLIVNNRASGTRAASLHPRSPSRGIGQEFPSAKSVVLMDPLGGGFDNASPDLQSMFDAQGAGYSTSVVDPTLQNLRHLGTPGILYFNTHGGAAIRQRDGALSFGMWSTTPVPADETQYDAQTKAWFEADEPYIFPMLGVQRSLPNDIHVFKNWAITPRFVREYWTTLPANSLVHLDVCLGERPEMTAALRNICSAYLLWSGLVNNLDVSRYFYDRLLGANVHQAETPPQRPFDLLPVWSDISKQGKNRSGTATLNIHFGASGSLGTFKPSIRSVSVDEEKGELTILGIFGPRTGDEQVTVDGSQRTILAWDATGSIKVSIPPSGAGSAGAVKVIVQGHESNARMLTEWKFRIHHTDSDLGTLHETVDLDLHFRADVATIRYLPHDTPEPQNDDPVTLDAVKDSGATFSASGRDDVSGLGCTASAAWSEGITVPLTYNPPANQDLNVFAAQALYDPDLNALFLKLTVKGSIRQTFSLQCPGITPTNGTATFAGGALLSVFQDIQARLKLPLDASYGIQTVQQSKTVGTIGATGGAFGPDPRRGTATLDIAATSANFPPPTDMQRSAKFQQQ